MQFLSRAEVRQIDQDAIEQLGIPGLLLMENAARGVCEQIQRTGPWQQISIVCGYGNNGGDGYVVARLAYQAGLSVRLFSHFSAEKASEDAKLASELTNPLADLLLIPVEMNYDQDIGPEDEGWKFQTNIMPVIPFHLSEEWNLISRTVV
ncbi:MAG: NAD(P)H-hydrate epimerase, partial [Planctomycetaceae bacterium]